MVHNEGNHNCDNHQPLLLNVPEGSRKEVSKLIKKFNDTKSMYLALRLSQILGFEPDLSKIYGNTNEPVRSIERITYLQSLPTSEYF